MIEFNEIYFTKIRDVKSPVRGHEADAGIDFFIPEDFETTTVGPNESVLIPSGIKVNIPKNYALIFKEKSGVATKKDLLVGAAVVDSGYTGEMHFHLINTGKAFQVLEPGDKITQGLVVPVVLCQPKEISNEEYEIKYCNTERGEGGFGSTGTK